MGQADTGLPPQRPSFDPRLSMWALWWKSDMYRFSSKHFSFPLSMLFHKCSILTKSSTTNNILSAIERQTQSHVQNRKLQEVEK
jgi:hypothetical protein